MSARSTYGNVTRTPFALAMAALGVFAGVRGFVDPTSSTLYLFIGVFAYAWSLVYGVGGTLMLWGMATLHTKSEAAGCTLFGFGAGAQAVASAVLVDRSPLLSWYGVLTLVVIAICSFIRVGHLIRGQRLVWLGPNGIK